MPSSAGSSRRSLLLGLGLGLSLTGLEVALPIPPSHASLVRFPADVLNNRYFLVRAGESYAESFGEPLTNPVWKTSERHGLSEFGKEQVLRGIIPELSKLGSCEDGSCWLWPSITQNSYQTAEVVAYVLGVGRSRIVPEYSFLDARGLGALERVRLDTALEAIAEGDSLDSNWRPPKGEDGTPHESAQDVLVRMRQMMSITETQYSGDDVIIISPDSDCLSVLQAAVLGVDLRQHRRYAFRSGEVRPLQLAAEAFDGRPMRFSCPDPPKCTQRAAPAPAPAPPQPPVPQQALVQNAGLLEDA
ncbi:hypothetical protein HYH03_000535 [Edaphochlamys debaryana]|uniref:Phosphoglycerate mutase n=1 Tax=Edaphochlamys debaryana TaxID=47281 RepID=A0A835YJD9_9CHLO|nr:hypothetical protein HYH03_000535 [Edaphochlamys debaryana]|eukprot:KAG2502041.1 hypothetical protein HYH03_000535 [Edaphochlamys debaryana]